tara:strand:- start:204 stop:923 length:720 start_codon:yes stop_codon:yes gene_type:complete
MEIEKRARNAERNRRLRAADPQKFRDRVNAAYAADPQGHRARNAESRRRRRAANPQKFRDRDNAAYAADPQKFRDKDNARRAADPQKFRDRANARRAADPQKFRDRANAAYAADPQKFRDQDNARRAADPQKFRDQDKARRAKDPQKHRAKGRAGAQKRKARTLKAEGWDYATVEKLQARWDMFGGKCWMCCRPADAMDHVKPLAAGGSNFPSNQRPACTSCNSRKHAKWPYPTSTVAA